MAKLSIYSPAPSENYSLVADSSRVIVPKRELDNHVPSKLHQQPRLRLLLDIYIAESTELTAAPGVHLTCIRYGSRVVVTSIHLGKLTALGKGFRL